MLRGFDLVWGDTRCDIIQVSTGSADFSRFEHADTKPDLGEPTQLRMQVCAVALHTVRELKSLKKIVTQCSTSRKTPYF